jgi:hypothetical protein
MVEMPVIKNRFHIAGTQKPNGGRSDNGKMSIIITIPAG